MSAKGLILVTATILVVGGSRLQAEITFLNAWGKYGTTAGTFDSPEGIAVVPQSLLTYNSSPFNVYVVDNNNTRVERFSAEGNYYSEWGGIGTGPGLFGIPIGIAASPTSQLYVVDYLSDRIQLFNESGVFQTEWGSTGSGNGQFAGPFGIDVSPNGNVYVVDYGNDRVQRFSPEGTYQLQWGSSGTGKGNFDGPFGIAVDPTSESVYVVDAGNDRIQRFSSDGEYIGEWGSSGSAPGTFDRPIGVAVQAGHVYVVDNFNHRVQRFSTSGTFEVAWGAPGSEYGQFSSPEFIAVTPTGQVYVTDTGNNRVQRFFDSEAWVSGTNVFTNTAYGPVDIGVGPGELLGPGIILDPPKRLIVGGRTTIWTDGELVLGGGDLKTGTLAFEGGTLGLASSYTLSNSDIATIAVEDGSSTVDTRGYDLTIYTQLVGTGTLNKVGAGVLSIAQSGGVGQLNISGGTVQVNDNLVTGVTNIEPGGTLDMRYAGHLSGELSNSGVLLAQGDGNYALRAIVSGPFTNHPSGVVRVSTQQRLAFTDPLPHSNSGILEVIDGELEFVGPLHNAIDTGQLVGRNATFRFGGTLSNDGLVGLSFGTSDVFGPIDNSPSGRIVISGASNATFYGNLDNEGVVQVSQGSSAVYLGTVSGGGSFTGAGTNYFEGDVLPGSSPGRISVEGDAVFSRLSTLGIELGGTAEAEFDALEVAGETTLEGTLAVSLIDPTGGAGVFEPAPGDTFRIIDSVGGVAGMFDEQQLPTLGTHAVLEVFYETDGVTLAVVPSLTGDYNFDGVVGIADYTVWRNTLGATGIGSAADGDGSGTVDAADYGIWRANFGNVASASSPLKTAVPEPSAIAVVTLLGGILVLARRS